MSESGKKEYVNKFKESAKAMWGAEAASEFNDPIEQTAAAVYAVNNYPLDPEVEPVTKMRLEE